MRLLSLAAAIASIGAIGITAAPAQAAGGCGWGYHPTLFGCHPNYRPPVVVAAPYGYRPVVYPAVVRPHRYWGWHPWGYGW
ncbi:GCG_CRPN prefix-to-repeats domain-containing protein [Sphingomonas abietis]|uniref:Sulfur globule protein n=1 Tax=Sphingomonas abietis TaxID=3012344 RepID=A0ABY7NGW8_9SPHN|nr:hypothetical protein [Sphingomonas abietis]WBO20734.1 hypothetical protein PBT88_10965 [Sphingomonas abietis]